MVVPGLIDTHLHITGPGGYATPIPPEKRRNYSVDWRGVKNKQDVLNQIRGIMERYKPPRRRMDRFQQPVAGPQSGME